MKIRKKITLGLSAILFVLGLILNVSIKKFLTTRMENNINTSLKTIMSSTRESIKYRLATSDEIDELKVLAKESENISNYIYLNYNSKIQLINLRGDILVDTIEEEFKELISGKLYITDEGQAIVNIKYINNSVYGILSYPIYIDGVKIGTLNLSKEFKEVYSENKETISMITLMEIIIFIAIFTAAYLMTSKITKPISILTEEVKKIGEGEYECNLSIKGSDEVSILTKEFIDMGKKIKLQIDTIKAEKEKVLLLEKSRKRFFDNVTHEIKTPITAITGYAELIKDSIVKDEEFEKRAISRIYSESERLNLLIGDLISISKGLSLIEEEFAIKNIKFIIEEIADDMRIKANKYSLNIICSLDSYNIYIKENKFRELIINLLDNAIKYSTKNTTINLHGELYNDIYEIIISNYGGPIEEEVYRSIFEPFIKNKNAKDENSRGLGLYICKEIVEAHNGSINIINGNEVKVVIKLFNVGNNLEISKDNLEKTSD